MVFKMNDVGFTIMKKIGYITWKKTKSRSEDVIVYATDKSQTKSVSVSSKTML